MSQETGFDVNECSKLIAYLVQQRRTMVPPPMSLGSRTRQTPTQCVLEFVPSWPVQRQFEWLTQQASEHNEWMTNHVSDINTRVVALDDIEDKLDDLMEKVTTVINIVKTTCTALHAARGENLD